MVLMGRFTKPVFRCGDIQLLWSAGMGLKLISVLAPTRNICPAEVIDGGAGGDINALNSAMMKRLT